MSRLQLALNVGDLNAAIEYYSVLFKSEPAKVRDGYANFAIADPPLKLVLIESTSADSGSLNHLGVEVESSADVVAATQHLSGAGLETIVREGEDCCHALQDKVWTTAPDGNRWEVYTILADSPEPAISLTVGGELPLMAGATSANSCAPESGCC